MKTLKSINDLIKRNEFLESHITDLEELISLKTSEIALDNRLIKSLETRIDLLEAQISRNKRHA